MKKYIMTEEEFNALDKVLWKSGLSKHGGLDVTQANNEDCFMDYEQNEILSFKDGLQIVYESGANDICFENKDIEKEDYDIVNNLFNKFKIGE